MGHAIYYSDIFLKRKFMYKQVLNNGLNSNDFFISGIASDFGN